MAIRTSPIPTSKVKGSCQNIKPQTETKISDRLLTYSVIIVGPDFNALIKPVVATKV